jgi:hypothetical protein
LPAKECRRGLQSGRQIGIIAVQDIASTSGRNSFDYQGLKDLGKQIGRPVGTLIAQSPQNDPFYAGAPARLNAAEWFANLWDQIGFGRGIHLRGVHYKIVSQNPPVLMPNGKAYENTNECWHYLGAASKDARHLDLVPANYWVDRKSEAVTHLVEPAEGEIEVADVSGLAWDAPSAMPDLPSLTLERPTVAQPYHVELWCEKTTINEILLTLAQRYGLNVVTGEGELSVTACHNVVERALASQRPVRILCVTDFDPAGQSIPLTIARKIEHLIYRRGLDLDLQVRSVALTREQIVRLDIPPIPLKESERRAEGFTERYGGLAAELDALEALHPGELERILAAEIERYYDPDLESATDDVAADIENDLEDITNSVHAHNEAAIADLAASWAEISASIEAWKDRAETVWHGITRSLSERAPDLDAYDWPAAYEAHEDPDPLFDSTRDYVDQINRYKRAQGKPTARQPRP